MVRAYTPQRLVGSLSTNSLNAPQGIGGEQVVIEGDPLLAVYPAIGDRNYLNYKFYQVNKEEVTTPQTDFIWEITSSVGPGVFKQASGFDIRAFQGTQRTIDISKAVDTGISFSPNFATAPTILSFVLSENRLHLYGIQRDADMVHDWELSAPGVLPADGTPPDFSFNVIAIDMRVQDIFVSRDGTLMVLVGSDNDMAYKFTLPVPYSFSITPILIDTFDLGFIATTPSSIDFSPDGMKMIINNTTDDSLFQWNLLASFEFPAASTAPDITFLYNPPIAVAFSGCRYSRDGSILRISALTPDQISSYILSTPYDIPTVNVLPDFTLDTSLFINNPRATTESPDAATLWVTNSTAFSVVQMFIPGVPLDYEVISINVNTGDFTIKVKVPSIEDLTFIQLAFGNATDSDGSTALGAGTTLSTFETPLLTKDIDTLLADDQGRVFVEAA